MTNDYKEMHKLKEIEYLISKLLLVIDSVDDKKLQPISKLFLDTLVDALYDATEEINI